MSGETPDDMRCGEVVEAITDYLDDAIPARDRARFEAHLERCRACAKYLGQMRETIAALAELREQSLDPRARKKLLAVFRGWRAGRNGTRPHWTTS